MIESAIHFAQVALLALYITTVALMVVDNYRTGGWFVNMMLTPFILIGALCWPIIAAIGTIAMVLTGGIREKEQKGEENEGKPTCSCSRCRMLRRVDSPEDDSEKDIDRD